MLITANNLTYNSSIDSELDLMPIFNQVKHKLIFKKNHVWSLKRRNIPYNIKWEIIGGASPFTPVTEMCRLCLLEKYHIMYSKWGATLNQRSEFFSHCYHKDPSLLFR